jgi:DNA-binding transcriptional ArsR family regulator
MSNDSAISQLADLFHLLGDPTRLAIVLACLQTPLAVSEIASRLQISTSLASHHLRLLRGARIVKAERNGKQVFYCAQDHHISSVLTDMLEHVSETVEGQD